MKPISISLLTICGLDELTEHSARAVTHVLSIVDPDYPDPDAFRIYDSHHRTILRFHDVIEPYEGFVPPEPGHVEAILAFGESLRRGAAEREDAMGHLLVHCHAGISRSTAAMAMLLAQTYPDQDEDSIFERLLGIRSQAWPNSRMIGFADRLLGRKGRFDAALGRLYARQLAVRPDLDETMRRHGRGREVDMARLSRSAA
jgi:predicted protein tyrosine phosphatase